MCHVKRTLVRHVHMLHLFSVVLLLIFIPLLLFIIMVTLIVVKVLLTALHSLDIVTLSKLVGLINLELLLHLLLWVVLGVVHLAPILVTIPIRGRANRTLLSNCLLSIVSLACYSLRLPCLSRFCCVCISLVFLLSIV